MSTARNTRLSARLWWSLLPFAGETGYPNPDNPPRWFAYPLTWLWRLVGRLPSSDPFAPGESCPECGVGYGALHRPDCFFRTGDPDDLRDVNA